jgi:O-antigen ligase
MMSAGVSLPTTALAPRIALALVGLMVAVPFLNFHHGFPLPTFYTEWMSFALGTAALVALVLIPRGEVARIPLLSLGLIGLLLVLVIQAAAGTVAYVERSLFGALYLLWAALLVWLGARLREQCGVERLGLVLQACIALGGFLAVCTGFILYYGIDVLGFRLISGPGMDGMYGAIAQRNNFANYLACALASVVFLFGGRRLGLVPAALLAVPLVLGLVLSTSRGALIYVLLVAASACWIFWRGDRKRLKPFLAFALFALALFVGLNFIVMYRDWFAGGDARSLTLGARWLQTVASDQAQLGVQVRIYLLREAWAMFSAHPLLGAGFGEFAWNLLEHGASFDGHHSAMAIHAHNLPLHLLAETGLLGTLCVVAPLGLWLWALPWTRPDLDTGWVLTLVAIEAAHSMVEFPLWHANFLGLTAVVLGAVAQPAVALRFSGLRQTALALVLAGGIAALGSAFLDYRRFEGWYREADASQRKGAPLSMQQLQQLSDQRAESLFAGYYDLLASELLLLNGDDLDAKLALNGDALRFIPIPGAVFRQAVLLSLKGERDQASRMFSRLAETYPGALAGDVQRLRQLAVTDPGALGAFAAQVERDYGRGRPR